MFVDVKLQSLFLWSFWRTDAKRVEVVDQCSSRANVRWFWESSSSFTGGRRRGVLPSCWQCFRNGHGPVVPELNPLRTICVWGERNAIDTHFKSFWRAGGRSVCSILGMSHLEGCTPRPTQPYRAAIMSSWSCVFGDLVKGELSTNQLVTNWLLTDY